MSRHEALRASWAPGQIWETRLDELAHDERAWVPVGDDGRAEPKWHERQEYRLAPDEAASTDSAPAGHVLVPLDASESLCGQLCGYGADLGYMDPRDRGVIIERGRARWAEILGWAAAGAGGNDGR